MPVPAVIRDSFIGQLIYYGSGRRMFRYPEEKPDFILPERYTAAYRARHTAIHSGSSGASNTPSRPTSVVARKEDRKDQRFSVTESTAEGEGEGTVGDDGEQPQESTLAHEYLHSPPIHDVEKAQFIAAEHARIEAAHLNPNIVEWYGPDDPDCPLNWSLFKRCLVTFDICLITFAIYIGSALFAPGIPDMAVKFHISEVAATLGLTMFIIGYGIGPMFLSPLSEIPQFGRAPVYMVTLIIFVALQVPTALAKNIGTIASLRFLAGFFGSPPLATGGASLADVWAPEDRAVVIGLWGMSAMCGPVIGPTIGGFAAQAKGWTWTIWILLWLSGASLAFLALFMPETSSQTILYHRAVRLRRLTGNHELRSQGEVDGQHMTLGDVAMMTLVRPFVLGFCEPIVACWNVYIALVYGILYCFIASFNVVFIEHHGFNLGQNGLAFLGIICGVFLSFCGFLPWAIYSLKPRFKPGGTFVPENRLPLAFFGAVFLPVSMFWFGWTSAGSIHWIVPILASTLWAAGAFLLFQAGLNYLVDCYPRYAASVLAGNDFFRSMLGASFPLFSTAFFHNLGVGQACSVLGGVSVGMLPIPFVLYIYGARIRAWSKFAD